MAFFDDLTKKVSQVGNDTAKKAKELAEIAKLNGQIGTAEKTINDLYIEIGKKFFAENAETTQEGYAAFISDIKSQMDVVKECREKITQLKGVVACEQCGNEIPADSAFCPGCGAKVERKIPEDKMACPLCSELIEKDSKFCVKCGGKLTTEE